ncbi:HD domain-containing phosphohydrolase, partial [Nostoc sp. NIES-2111]
KGQVPERRGSGFQGTGACLYRIDPMKLMIVDDNETMLTLMKGIVCRFDGCEAATFTDPAEALAACKASQYDVLMLDCLMPGMDGIGCLREVRQLPGYRELPFVMVTASDDKQTCIDALEAGATDFLCKPFTPAELRARLQNLAALRRAQIEHANREEWLAREVENKTRVLQAREKELVTRLARAIETRDHETGDHVLRMAEVSRLIAEGWGLDQARSSTIALAATLHDVGKIGVPDGILSKPGALTHEERAIMCEHVTIGAEILSDGTSDLMKLACTIAAAHHERWDGKGYPNRLAGEDIPLEGRIAAVADVFEALCADRVYRPAFPIDEARRMILEGSGTQFDPACVAAFERKWAEIRAVVDRGPAEEDEPAAERASQAA